MATHATETSLRGIFRGSSTADEVEETIAHVAVCRECWRLAAAVLARVRKEGGFTPSSSGAALARIIASEEQHTFRVLRVRAALDEIKTLAPGEQRKRILSAAYLRNQLFFRVILEETEKLTRTDPHAAEALAVLAMDVAELLPARGYSAQLRTELRAEALTYIANCRRLAADWKGARAALAQAGAMLETGWASPRREAFWLLNGAALAGDMGQIEIALSTLQKSAALYTEDHDAKGRALTGVLAASFHLAAGQYKDACAHSEMVLKLPLLERRLELLARGIEVEGFVRLGQITEAKLRFGEMQSLFAELHQFAAHESYLQAVLLDATGHLRESEKRFREAARRFLDTDHYWNAMLCFLSLFEALVKRGSFSKAIELCEEILAERALMEGRQEIRSAWVHILGLLRTQALVESAQLWALRQFIVRCWNNRLSWARFEATGTTPVKDSVPALEIEPRPEPKVPMEEPKVETLSGEAYYLELERHERELFSAVVRSCGFSIRATARALNMSRNTVAAKMVKFGLTPAKSEPPADEP